MDSAESLERWKKRYSSVVQEGKLSRDDAERKLRLGEKNLGRAKRNLEVDPDEALINAETAIVNAADAVLGAGGFRVRRLDRTRRGLPIRICPARSSYRRIALPEPGTCEAGRCMTRWMLLPRTRHGSSSRSLQNSSRPLVKSWDKPPSR